jgi:hypothetical protein
VIFKRRLKNRIYFRFLLFLLALFGLFGVWGVAGGNARHTAAFTVDGKFSLSPNSSTFKKGCESSINIIIDTGSNESNAANIIINYNPSEIEIIDSNLSKPGVQIALGSAYEAYADNVVDESTGKIRLTGLSISSSLKGKGTFGIIHFRSKPGVENTTLSIVFDGVGKTLDSNIAETNSSDDILAMVENGNYSFVEGRCFEDTTPPSIDPIYPKNFDLEVPPDTVLEVKICDSDSGVDIKSVKIDILGEIYTYSDTENFKYTGDPTCYDIKLKPREPFPTNRAILVVYAASDYKGSKAQTSIIFNIPAEANELVKTIVEKEKEVEECQGALVECKEDAQVCEDLGISPLYKKIYNLLRGKERGERPEKGYACKFSWLSLVAFLVLFVSSYIRHFFEYRACHSVVKFILRLIIASGFIASITGTIVCKNWISLAITVMYLVVAGYGLISNIRSRGRINSQQQKVSG